MPKYGHKSHALSLIRGVAPAAALAMAAVPGAALANGFYLGVSSGIGFPDASPNEGELTSAVPATADFGPIPNGTDLGWRSEFNTGWVVNSQLGYDFGNGFRIEAEGNYSRFEVDRHVGLNVGGANIDALNSAVLTRGPALAANPSVGALIANDAGQVDNFGVFGNLLYDINTGTVLKPYLGAGIGFQWADVSFMPSGVNVGSGTDGGLAYQLMAGASFELSPSIDLFGQYTFREMTGRATIDLDLLPANLGVHTSHSLLTAGLRFRFGD